MYIYKYLTFTQFIDMVESQRLYLTRISEWEDVYEAIGLKKVVSQTMKTLAPPFVPEMMGDELLVALDKIEYYSYYAQSWTSSEKESDAMWRIYSPQREGVRIKMKVDLIEQNMKKAFKEIHSNMPLYHSSVVYRNDNLGPINVKREAFNHEEEYRFWTVLQMGSFSQPPEKPFVNEIDSFIHYLDKCYRENPKSIYYPVTKDMIEEVTLDPRAAFYHEQTFNNYCNNRKLKKGIFSKSTLYTEMKE